MTTQLRTERIGTTLVFTLDGPTGQNALSSAVYAAGVEALNVAESSPDLRCVILTGAGGCFSSGDLEAVTTAERMDALGRWIEALYAFPKPVVAAVEGVATGTACALALACDLLVAARDARFSPAPAGQGLALAGGIAHALSRQQALEWLWLAPTRDAAALHALGLVNQVTDSGQALAAALALCERLSALPAAAVAARKELMNQAAPRPLAAYLALEREVFMQSRPQERP